MCFNRSRFHNSWTATYINQVNSPTSTDKSSGSHLQGLVRLNSSPTTLLGVQCSFLCKLGGISPLADLLAVCSLLPLRSGAVVCPSVVPPCGLRPVVLRCRTGSVTALPTGDADSVSVRPPPAAPRRHSRSNCRSSLPVRTDACGRGNSRAQPSLGIIVAGALADRSRTYVGHPSASRPTSHVPSALLDRAAWSSIWHPAPRRSRPGAIRTVMPTQSPFDRHFPAPAPKHRAQPELGGITRACRSLRVARTSAIHLSPGPPSFRRLLSPPLLSTPFPTSISVGGLRSAPR